MRIIFMVLIVCCIFREGRAADIREVARLAIACQSKFQAVSPTGGQVAVKCRDHSLRLIDVGTGREVRVFPAEDHVTDLSYSRDGRWLAVGRHDGAAQIVSTSDLASGKRWQATSRRVEVVQFLGDDHSVLVAGIDEPGQIWEVSGTPTVRASFHSNFAGLTACAVSSDGKHLAAADGDTVLRVYNTATWRIEREYTDLKLETFALSFAKNDRLLLAGGAGNHISMIDLASGAASAPLGPERDAVGAIIVLDGGQRAALSYFDPDGHRPDHDVIWNVNTLKTEPLAAKGAPTGRSLVRGKLWFAQSSESALQLWEYQ